MKKVQKYISRTIFNDNTLISMVSMVMVGLGFALLGAFVWAPFYALAILFMFFLVL